jgi:hypothetical protein
MFVKISKGENIFLPYLTFIDFLTGMPEIIKSHSDPTENLLPFSNQSYNKQKVALMIK